RTTSRDRNTRAPANAGQADGAKDALPANGDTRTTLARYLRRMKRIEMVYTRGQGRNCRLAPELAYFDPLVRARVEPSKRQGVKTETYRPHLHTLSRARARSQRAGATKILHLYYDWPRRPSRMIRRRSRLSGAFRFAA